MIVKKHGKRDTSNAYELNTLEFYSLYRDMCFDLAILKKRRYMKPMIITTLVSSAIALFTQLPEMFMFSMFMVFLTMFFFMLSMFTEHELMPVKTSESGNDLSHIPYPITDHNIIEAMEQAEKIYGPPRRIVGSPVFQEEPLKVPVVLDGKPVVGALVEVELEDNQQPTEYFLMFENGQTLQVDREHFMDTIQHMYPDENGTKQYIPVLTGREDSILWGLLGDAEASMMAAYQKQKVQHSIIAFRKAIHNAEELLAFLALQNMSNNRR